MRARSGDALQDAVALRPTLPAFETPFEHVQRHFRAIAPAGSPGLWLEFGVAQGSSALEAARSLEACAECGGLVYGFDTFSGLPDAFRHEQPPQHTPLKAGEIVDGCVSYVKGYRRHFY